jgi:hypothetical protein
MSKDGKSIYDGLKYLYAEQLKNKRVKLTIKAIRTETVVGDGGRKTEGHVLSFEETPKELVVTGSTIKRQLAIATQTDDVEEMVGKTITIYPVASSRSISGQAIRVAIPEHAA